MMIQVRIKNFHGPDVFYFTFGQLHRHPNLGHYMADYWVEIHADNSNQAREWMFENYGDKWSMMYTANNFHPEFYPGGAFEKIHLTTKKENDADTKKSDK